MVWANIKTARPLTVIDALQERDEHEVVFVTKLNRPDTDMYDPNGEEHATQQHSLLRFRKDAGNKKINEQAAQNGVNIGSGQVGNRREKGSRKDVTEKKHGAREANLIRRWFGAAQGKESEQASDGEQSVGR